MAGIKVSVIMPCHNGEKYIRNTMNMLLSQSLKDMELICVDDESDDSTFEILREYEAKDSRVHAFRQKKSNAGAARNLGTKNASGEYLIFLDSDDVFETNMLEVMYTACIQDRAELCICNADQYDVENGKYRKAPKYLIDKFLPKSFPFSREDMQEHILSFTRSVPWNKMVKADFLSEQGIAFQEIARANDQFFSIMCLILAKRITVVKDKLVHYQVKQKENLTNTFSQTPLCSYEAMLAVKQELERRELLKEPSIRQAFDNKILNMLIYTLNIQSDYNGFRQLYEKMKEEGFERLGVVEKERDYYFNEKEYNNLRYILQYSCQEYLAFTRHEYYEKLKEKTNALREKNAEIKRLSEKEKELKTIQNTWWYKFFTRVSN